jgi:hypothetical protein
MADKNNKDSNEPISLSLKVVIYLAIVSGIFIGSWEIVNNIPKYEYINDINDGTPLIFNKINGNVYLFSENIVNNTIENGLQTFNLISVISEEKYIDRKNRVEKKELERIDLLWKSGKIDSLTRDKMIEGFLLK